MRFFVLGSLEARTNDGRALGFGRGRSRQLLAMLLLQANTTVTDGALIEGLWESLPPRSAMANLRSYACVVRRLLAAADGCGARRLLTQPGGYRLEASADELDLLRWEEFVIAGMAAHQAGDRAGAVEKLTQAHDLWRGPLLGGLVMHGRFRACLAALEEQHFDARETLIEARLDLGAHRELTSELLSLVGEHPLRERLWAHLMVALYRSGRQTEALRAYHEVRQKLVTEVGVEPGPELQTIERAILTADPTLTQRKTPHAPL